MTNFSKTLTFSEAKELYTSIGMHFVNTDHNRKMMKSVVDAHLMELRGENA